MGKGDCSVRSGWYEHVLSKPLTIYSYSFFKENAKIEIINASTDGTPLYKTRTIDVTTKTSSSKSAPLDTRESIIAFYKFVSTIYDYGKYINLIFIETILSNRKWFGTNVTGQQVLVWLHGCLEQQMKHHFILQEPKVKLCSL